MLKIFALVFLCFVNDASTEQYCEADDKYSWSYHGPDNDPSHWGDIYPDCNEKDQSPIEITEKNIVELNIPELQYTGFDKPITKAKIQNLGWTVMLTPEDDEHRYVTWGDTTYTFENIHFHFGTENDPGAEHVIEGVTYPMEIHFYTRSDQNKKYSAIVAALMNGEDDDNSAFDPITEVLSDVKYRGDSTELKSNLILSDFLPEDNGSYYYYYGRNSIPPCNPDYTWWVLKEIGKVGNSQLNTFMTLYSVGEDNASESCLMGPNCRPVQDLDHRLILSSEQTSNE